MNPVENVFQAIIAEANNFEDGMSSYVWYDDFDFDDCKWLLSTFLHSHSKCNYIGHGCFFIPDVANKPFFVEVCNEGAYIYSKEVMKGTLVDEELFIERLKETIKQADELS